MEELTVSIVQADLVWEDKVANLEKFERLFENISKTDLIVLPEMFNTAYSMNAKEIAESMEGPTVEWMHKVANTFQCAITGSLVIEEDNHYYNRMLFITPDHSTSYDKRHLFTMAGEEKVYTAGEQRRFVIWKNWKINLNICYDLRFPVWSRNTDSYDIMINVASWPGKRISHWDSLLKARAIENQAYILAVNRVGEDANGFDYNGHSSIYNPQGDLLKKIENQELCFTIDLSKSEVKKIRSKLPFLKDRDHFSIHLASSDEKS